MTLGNLAFEIGLVSIVDITGDFFQDEKEPRIINKLMKKPVKTMIIQRTLKILEFVDPM